jgi:hypothetical protein
MCEHREQLQKAAFELELMLGNQTINLARLKQLLNQECEHGGIE